MERLSVLYASALFDLAKSKGITDDILNQAALVRDSLKDEECQRILVHPHISAKKKHEFFSKAFAGQVHDDLLGLLFLAAEKNREAYILPALTALIEMINHHNHNVTAKVFCATELDDEQVVKMKDILSKRLDKNVDISMKVDPSVIGGPYIFVDGYYLDWTVKTRLRDLTVQLKEGCSA